MLSKSAENKSYFKLIIKLQSLLFFVCLSFFNLAQASQTLNVPENNYVASQDALSTQAVSDKKILPKPSPEMLKAMESLNDKSRAVDDGLTNAERIQKYLKSGFVHILPMGLDHILFVLALFFSTVVFKKLFWQITAFTLAHSVTLVMSSLGLISLSGDIVEPLIALSIAWMAIDNIRNENTSSMRIWLIVFFGLLHGLGFASVLSEFGLPKDAFLSALFSFNVGVELGQLTVLLGATALFYYWSKKPSYRAFIQVPMSALIALVGLFWFFERIM